MARRRHPGPPSVKGGDNPQGSNTPPREYRGIVHSIDSLTKEISSSNQKNDTYQSDSLWWTKRTAIAVGVYTLLTIGILAASIQQGCVARDTEIVANRAFVISNSIRLVSYDEP